MEKEKIERMCNRIIEETYNPYEHIIFFQREELSKEELYQYAEQMREKLNNIFDLVFDLKNGKSY